MYLLPLIMPSRVGTWWSLKFSVTSYTADTKNNERQKRKPIINTRPYFELRGYVCVRDTCMHAPPVPLRHFSVVVKPLVLGSRWYLSLGRPLLSATSILIWCFFSVKRVPSQYSRNFGDRKRSVNKTCTHKGFRDARKTLSLVKHTQR